MTSRILDAGCGCMAFALWGVIIVIYLAAVLSPVLLCVAAIAMLCRLAGMI